MTDPEDELGEVEGLGEVPPLALGAFPLAYYDIIQVMAHTLLVSKSIADKAQQAKVRRIKAVIGNFG